MSAPVLQLTDVTMQFGGVVAVDNLSLEVYEGEIVALIGPNGAGKTTAFNVVTGMYTPTNGEVRFKERVIASAFPSGNMTKLYAGQNKDKYKSVISHTPDRITRLGVARTFQNIRLFKDLTVLENVLIAKHMNIKAGMLAAAFRLNRKEEKQMHDDARALLAQVGLEALGGEVAGSLPYGKQRRLEIARALATKPELLLLDEPAAGMNPKETDELAAFISRIRSDFKLTIFMIEHHMDLVMESSERIYVIDFGRLIAAGSPEEVQQNPAVIEAYLGVEEE